MQFLLGTADGSGHRCPCLVPGTKIFPASSSTKKMHFKHQQCCLGSHLPEQRGSGRGKVSMQKSRAIPHCMAVPAPLMAGPSLPTQAVQGRSLLWTTHLGFACGHQISKSSGSYSSRHLVIMRIGSLRISQGLGFSFPFKKAKKHQRACEQASHAKATEQPQEKR